MKFTTYGDVNNPAVLLMHGMCQDWHSMYDFLHDLEAVYYLIVPGMDGFYGVSQGTIVLSELLARNRISIEKAFFDGTYVAHQGKIAGLGTNWMFATAKKRNGKFFKAMNIMMSLMGLSENDMIMLNYIYWDATYTSIKNNIIQNYTYRVNPSIATARTEVILCCGSKEPYAKRSHKILMKYLKNVREIILEGYGHGQMMYFQGNKLSKMIIKEWEINQ